MILLIPAWLLLSSLTLVVLALHRRKRRRIEVSSILLWRRLEDAAAPRRLKRPPLTVLLLLQLLVVVLAALALAQPLLGRAAAPAHTVYLLDISGSMRTADVEPSRFGAAQAFLSDAVRSMRENERVSVIEVGATAAVRVARQDTASGILPLVDRLAVTDAGADWTGAAALVPSLVRDGESTRLVVLGDDPAAAAFLGAEMAVESRLFGASPDNRSLTAAVVPVDPAGGAWRVEGRIEGAEGETVVAVRFLPEGDTTFLDWTSVAISAADAASGFAFDLALPGPGAVVLSLPDDDGPADNVVGTVVASAPDTIDVLYVGPGNGPLVAALGANEGVAVTTAAALPADETRYDLVVVDGIAVPRRPAISTLWIGAADVEGAPPRQAIADVQPAGWRGEHWLSADIDWAQLEIGGAVFAGDAAEGATAVVQSGLVGLIEERLTEAGREIRVAFPIEAANWSDGALLPLFVRNVIASLGIERGTVTRSCVAGLPCAVPVRFAGAPATDIETGIAVLLPRDSEAWVPARAGLFRVGEGAGATLVAVNADPAERVAAVEASTPMTATASSASSVALWRWLLIAVLTAVLAEAWLAGRGEAGFLRWHRLRGSNPSAARTRTVFAAATVTVAFLVLAIANVPYPARVGDEDVVVVAAAGDVPEVEPPGGARLGIVTLDGAARVAADLAREPSAEGIPDGPMPATGLGEALQLAAAMLPGDRSGRVVLLSNGVGTGGAEGALPALSASAIPVDIVPLAPAPGEVVAVGLTAPNPIRIGDPFLLAATIFSDREQAGTVTMLRDGVAIAEHAVTLSPGTNRVDALVAEATPGIATYEIMVAADTDAVAENNRAGAIVRTTAEPRVAIITPDMSWGQYFADAIAIQGFDADVMLPQQAPFDLDGWLAFDVIVTMNAPALSFDTIQQGLLETAVSAHGRGLLILGGENSFGPGGYYQTAFERLSPLSSRTPRDAPQAAIMFVLDRSGSMQATVGAGNRLDIAKLATIEAIRRLSVTAVVGVIAFDSACAVIVPLGSMAAADAATESIERMQAGGGTALIPALSDALDALGASEAAVRHIVVLTDGLAEEGDFYALLQEARSDRITISTIATGEGADLTLLRQIANIGGGAFSATQDFKALPSILAREALLLAGSPVRSATVEPRWVDRGAAFLDGIGETLPPVRSYVVTTAKPAADVHLAVDDEDGTEVPLLASWRYGSGRVLAFATHGAGQGTRDWITAPDYPLLWSQAIRHFLPVAQGAGLHVAAERSGDAVTITADYVDAAEAPLTGAVLSATVIGEDGAALAVPLRETEPGRYRAMVTPGTGMFVVTVTDGTAVATADILIPYPARYDFSRTDFEPLRRIAAATGGSMLAGADISFGEPAWRAVPGWQLWTLLALGVFLCGLFFRNASRLFRRRLL
ncbi:MAG: VWA domain-containing protein [Bauldia sp.]